MLECKAEQAVDQQWVSQQRSCHIPPVLSLLTRRRRTEQMRPRRSRNLSCFLSAYRLQGFLYFMRTSIERLSMSFLKLSQILIRLLCQCFCPSLGNAQGYPLHAFMSLKLTKPCHSFDQNYSFSPNCLFAGVYHFSTFCAGRPLCVPGK